jgi:anti-sigma factor RsiW
VGVQDTGRPHDVTCETILASYSEYVDGLLPAHEAARVQWHLASCAACGRYDRVCRLGAELARELPEVEPSEDFAERLQHRLFHLQDGPALADGRDAGARATTTVAVAGVLALLAWSPVLLGPSAEAPPVRVAAEQVQEPAAVELTTRADELWSSAGFVPLSASSMMSLRSDVSHLLAVFPGPHSPLVVTPPVVHRVGREID